MPVINREYVFPDYVSEIFGKLSETDKELIVKNVILCHVEKVSETDYKISQETRDMSNRVEILPIDEVINALSLFAFFYAPMKEKVL